MPNVNDADDAYLSAKAEVDGFFEEAIAEWYRPYAEMAILSFWSRLPEKVREQLRNLAPEAYEATAAAVKRIGGNNGTIRGT